MKKEKIVSSLEFGSNQIKCAVGKIDINNTIEVIGFSSIDTGGLMGGSIVNMDMVSEAITNAVEAAENQASVKIDYLVVGIKGRNVESFNSTNSINISRTDKEIVEEDRDKVIDSAKQLQISADREIIETIIQSYNVDNQRGISDPVGLEGSHLGISAHVVTCSTTTLNNVIKSINRGGFKAEEVTYSVLAGGNSVLTEEEKRLGVMLIDFGNQFTDVAVYINGSVIFTKAFPIGGYILTRGISLILKTSEKTADELKKKYGEALLGHIKESEEIQYYGMDGHTLKSTNKKALCEIVTKCLEDDIFGHFSSIIDKFDLSHRINAGIVFTGGSANLKGLTELSTKELNHETRIGYSTDIIGADDIIRDPANSTILGLLKYFKRNNIYKGKRFVRNKEFKDIMFEFFRGWF